MDPRDIHMQLLTLRRDLETLKASTGGIPVRFAIGGGGSTLPKPTAVFQVLQAGLPDQGSTKPWKIKFDWVRAH
jgi:hypothetical protein